MKVVVPLEDGMLSDIYGKYAPSEFQIDGHPILSFPIQILNAPPETKSLALTFVDWDAIPVGGFCWIHWLACDFAADTTLIPENASASGVVSCVQGSNSAWSPLAGGCTDPRIIYRYDGPCPPDQDHIYTLNVYALDTKLNLEEGYYLNEFRRAIEGHVLAKVTTEFASRA